MSLVEFIHSLDPGEVIDYSKESWEPSPETTKKLLDLDKELKVALFKIRGSSFLCIANLLNSRYRLYKKVLNVESDEEAYNKLLYAIHHPKKPKIVSFENFFKRIDVDLERLPFIKFYPRDGGRYLTSTVYIVCIDELCNASIHRTMLISRDSVVARIVPRHLRYIYDEYKRRGKETPVAIVLGVHPVILLSAASSPPLGVFEIDVAASLHDIKVAYTPLYGLPVPVPSTVVMEGRITDCMVDEGPFVDILGLYDRVRKEPLIKIDAVYIGDENLINIIVPAAREHRILQSFYREALIWDYVRKVVPRVYKVRLIESGGSWLHAVISIEKLCDGDAKNAILAAFAAHPSLKMVTVVDPDIDPDDLSMVEWAIATRTRFSRDLVIIHGSRCSSLDPSSDDGICDKLGIDATIPMDKDRDRFLHVKI